MSTPRLTRSASRHALGAATNGGSTAPAPQTTTAKNAVSEEAKKTAGAKRAKAGKKPVEAAKAAEESPATPPRKRQRKAGPPPAAPESPPPKEGPQHHDGPKLDALAGQHVLEEEEESRHAPKMLAARPAEPHMTNAVLQTPQGSKISASYRKQDASPSKQPMGGGGDAHQMPEPTTDTNRLLSEAVAHLLKVEPRLKPVVDAHHCHVFSPDGLAEPVDPFRALTSGILAQQVSGAAAAAIKRRFVALFIPPPKEEEQGQAETKAKAKAKAKASIDEEEAETTGIDKGAFPAPAEVARASVERLRSAGLSQRKAEYVRGLAEKFAAGELSARLLAEARDEEVMERLTAVRGLGRWSAEMFMCFALKRLDVFSTGDLGVQRGMAALAGRDVARLKAKGAGGKWKYMSERDMLDMAAKFAPYRSVFMWYMWRVEDVNLDALQDN